MYFFSENFQKITRKSLFNQRLLAHQNCIWNAGKHLRFFSKLKIVNIFQSDFSWIPNHVVLNLICYRLIKITFFGRFDERFERMSYIIYPEIWKFSVEIQQLRNAAVSKALVDNMTKSCISAAWLCYYDILVNQSIYQNTLTA